MEQLPLLLLLFEELSLLLLVDLCAVPVVVVAWVDVVLRATAKE